MSADRSGYAQPQLNPEKGIPAWTLHHVAIEANNIEETLAWYHARFDVRTACADDASALLTFENNSLALVTPGQHPPHVAVQRDDTNIFGPLTARRDGTASVYRQEPCGNAVEILRSDSVARQEGRSLE